MRQMGLSRSLHAYVAKVGRSRSKILNTHVGSIIRRIRDAQLSLLCRFRMRRSTNWSDGLVSIVVTEAADRRKTAEERMDYNHRSRSRKRERIIVLCVAPHRMISVV